MFFSSKTPPQSESPKLWLSAVPVLAFFLHSTLLISPVFADGDVQHYDLEIQLDPDSLYLQAVADLKIQAAVGEGEISEIFLDLHGLTVNSVKWNNQIASWIRENDQLTIYLAQPLLEGESGTALIDYEGSPDPYLTDQGPLGIMQSNDITFAINVTAGAHYWFPCRDRLDDKASVDLALIVPTGTISAGPGHLESISTEAGGLEKHQWRMSQPVTPYLISFAFSPSYVRERFTLELDSGPKQAEVSLLADQWPSAWADIEPLPDMINYLEGRYGTFPYDVVAFHEIPFPGAVEQPGNIAMGTFYWTGTGDLNMYFAHELSHSWFQGWVTARTWDDIFLDESIAVWHEMLWTEQYAGLETADLYAYAYLLSYISSISDEGLFPISDPAVLFGYTIYAKGSLVWRLLEHLLGREDTLDLLRNYLQDADGIADLEDFTRALEATGDPAVESFREEWLDRAGLPTYRFGHAISQVDDGYALTLRLVQQNNPIYTTPIDVVIEYDDGRQETHTLNPTSDDVTETLCLEQNPAAVSLDPRYLVPRFPDGSVNVDSSSECGTSGCGTRRIPSFAVMPLLGFSLLLLVKRRQLTKKCN